MEGEPTPVPEEHNPFNHLTTPALFEMEEIVQQRIQELHVRSSALAREILRRGTADENPEHR